MRVWIVETDLTNSERFFPPRFEQFLLLLRFSFLPQDEFFAERVFHEDEGETVIPISSFTTPEGSLSEEESENFDFAFVIALDETIDRISTGMRLV